MPTPTPRDSSGSILGADWSDLARRRRSRAPLVVGIALVLCGAVATFGVQRGFRADVSAQSGKLLIVKAPDTVKANEPFDITVTAQTGGAVDTGYAGTVKFSSTEDTTFVIADYTFAPADQGAHTFSLAGKFASAGIRTINVVDAADSSITGSTSVEVTGGAGSTVGGAPVITAPANGATVNQATVTLQGTAAPNATVAVSDNDLALGSSTALADGSFSFDATNLAAGSHRFVATAGGSASAPVSITVQTGATNGAAPDLILSRETVAVAPGAVAPRIDAQVLADPNLKSVRLQVDQRLVDLAEDVSAPGTYKGDFLAPTTPNSYPVDVLIENVLGAAQTFSGVKTLVVTLDTAPLPSSITNTPPTASFVFTPVAGKTPLTVTFTTTASDKEDGEPVAYFWDFGDGTTSTEKNPVHIYRTAGPYAPRLTVRDSGGLEATVIANPEITASGPAMTAFLLAAAALLAYGVQRLKRRARA